MAITGLLGHKADAEAKAMSSFGAFAVNKEECYDMSMLWKLAQ
jgi:hypothetical protein